MTNERPSIRRKRILSAYVQDRMKREEEVAGRGYGAKVADATGFTTATASAAKEGKRGVGQDFAEALAKYWGFSGVDALHAEAENWWTANGQDDESGPPPIVPERTVELDNAVYTNLATALEMRPNIAQDVRDYVLSIRNYGGDQPVETWLKVIDRAQDAHELNERDLGYQPAFPKIAPPRVLTDDDFEPSPLPPKIPKRR